MLMLGVSGIIWICWVDSRNKREGLLIPFFAAFLQSQLWLARVASLSLFWLALWTAFN